MRHHRIGFRPAILFLGSLLLVAALPSLSRGGRSRSLAENQATLTLTAIMDQGIWTEESVTAGNHWRRDFESAAPRLVVGREVRLHLESADVVHSFSAPGLGIDAVEVYPGRGVDIVFTPASEGLFEFFCTTVCGEAHFAMRGFFEVAAGSAVRTSLPSRPGGAYWRTPLPPDRAGGLERGRALYLRSGCVTCHGEDGAGGVPNFNSMNPMVPELASLARRTFLFTPGEVRSFRRALGLGLAPDPGAAERLPLFDAARAQFEATRELVREGRRSATLDPSAPAPPLDMPAWSLRLNDADVDLILGYLLHLSEAEEDDSPNHTGDPR